MRSIQVRRKSKKGISGAVTALILVIASVIIALVVVGFAFGLFSNYASSVRVTAVGSGTLSSGGTAIFQLSSTGTAVIASVVLQTPNTQIPGNLQVTQLSAGVNTITVNFGSQSTQNLQPGVTYTVVVSLSNGQTVTVAVYYTGSS